MLFDVSRKRDGVIDAVLPNFCVDFWWEWHNLLGHCHFWWCLCNNTNQRRPWRKGKNKFSFENIKSTWNEYLLGERTSVETLRRESAEEQQSQLAGKGFYSRKKKKRRLRDDHTGSNIIYNSSRESQPSRSAHLDKAPEMGVLNIATICTPRSRCW